MSELIFHEHTEAALRRLLSHPRHAVVLVGPDGAGKTATADWLCRHLLHITASNLDPEQVLWLEPENKQLRVEQIRQAQHFAKTTAHAAKVQRIIVFSQADTMAEPAQNALLKLLEEPPVGVVLLLLAANENTLLPTIRSRSQVITILPVTKQQALALVPANADFDKLWRLSGGYAGKLVDLLTGNSAADIDSARIYLGSSTFEKVVQHEQFKDRQAAIQLVTNLLILCRSALNQAASQSKADNTRTWLRRSEACLAAQEQLHKNANVKLCLDVLALNLL